MWVTFGNHFEDCQLHVDYDGDGAVDSTLSPGGVTGVPDPGTPSPKRLTILAVVPNPFNPTTTIIYELPQEGQACVGVYDVSGRHIATLVDETRDAGRYETKWTGVDRNGAKAASGVYFVRLKLGNQSTTKKMVLLR